MKERKKTVVQTTQKTVETLDKVTGELTLSNSFTNKTMKVDTEPPYIKMYINDISRLNGLPEYVNNILHELLKNMGYNNVVAMYMPIKQMICQRLSIPLNSLNKAIDELYKAGILIRKARGFYILDPNLFGRGSWAEIKEIRLTIEYSNSGKRILKTDIKQQIELFETDNHDNQIQS